MSNATAQTVLTSEQEKFVWQFICSHMDDDDRNPNEVIKDRYAGDRSRYLREMAVWHGIYFCSACGKPNKKDPLVFQQNVEGKGVNLCGACAEEYQTWRSKTPSGKPDVEWFVHTCKPTKRT